MLEIGSLVEGKYKILSKVGQGGMSVVYMAINEKANKTWAIKEVRKDGVLDFEAVKQGLVAETEILKKLNHPSLPSIIDVIDTDDSFIIIMDYIEGNSLNKALQEYGAQPQEMVIEWAKQLCDVLGYLHTREKPIIYRDMKPANIMLKPDGTVTLIDFGTAREFKKKNLADTTCLGTIGYAAPEQFGGMGQTDARTDIYCLGATLYHLVTGRNPSEPPYEIKPIRQINPTLSSGLEKIIIKCVQRNPDDRYQSAAELMYALEHYEEVDDKFRKKEKKRLGAFILSIILCLLCLSSAVFAGATAKNKANSTYESMMESASLSNNKKEKINQYKQCINVPGKSGDKAAYTELLLAYIDEENGYILDEKSRNEFQGLIENNKQALKDSNNYTDVCYEFAKTIWYYYESDNKSNDNSSFKNRAKQSMDWFSKALENAPNGYDSNNKKMMEVYYSIGNYYKTIDKIAKEYKESSVNTIYKTIYENMKQIYSEVAKDESADTIVRIESMRFLLNVIKNDIYKLKGAGIKETELKDLINDVDSVSRGITVEKGTPLYDKMTALNKSIKTAKDVASDAFTVTSPDEEE